jgi:hypothetical protein
MTIYTVDDVNFALQSRSAASARLYTHKNRYVWNCDDCDDDTGATIFFGSLRSGDLGGR